MDLPAADYFTNVNRTNGEAKQGQDDVLAFIRQMVGGAAIGAYTIATGAITPAVATFTVDTQGAAATDELDTIVQTNFPDGSIIAVTMANAARVVTARHNQGGDGKLLLKGSTNFTCAVDTWLLLQCQSTSWKEIARFFGTAAELRAWLGLGTAALKNTGASGDAVPLLNIANTWSKGQITAPVSLTDAATVAWDLANGNKFKVTLGGNRTLGTPSNKVDGQSFEIVITQDGTGSRTLAYHADFKFPGGTAPVLSTAAGAVDRLVGAVHGSVVHASLIKGFA